MVGHRKNFGGVQTFADYSYDNIGNVKHAEYRYDSVPYTFVDYNYDRYNQLTKEVHSPLSMGIDLRSAEYAYDEFGNITDVTRTDSSGKVTKNRYVYSDKTGWQDLLTSYNGHTITYDEIGNPLSYYNGKNYSFVWEFGRQLCRSTSGGTDITYDYNKYGIRTDKTVKGKYTDRYILDGDRVIGMERTKSGSSVKDVYHFMYDEMGNIWLALCYIGGSTTPVRYYYRTNAQGDVKQIVDKDNNIIAYYAYDAWGRTLAILDGNDDPITNASHFAIVNPFRYRGYVYDNETGFYYLQSRYYDPEIGRFINADGEISDVGGDIRGYNLFAYCLNNPVNMLDQTGNWPKWIRNAVKWVGENIVKPIGNLFFRRKQYNIASISSHDLNERPNSGPPGSTYRAPNGDTRTYGPDGRPVRDYDHSDHGVPNKHPHDANGGHFHDWDWTNKEKPRGSPYIEPIEVITGIGITSACVLGFIFIVADDITGVGVGDDFLLAPLSAGISKGLIMIFE